MKTIFGQLNEYYGDKVTLADETTIVDAMPNLTETLRTKGELVEQDYDDNNIRCNIIGSGSAKDKLHMSRRRYVFLTNPALIACETIKKASAMLKSAESQQSKCETGGCSGTLIIWDIVRWFYA